MLIDLHVHTLLSSDSNIAPEAYLEAAARGARRLDAICFTEHRLFPADVDLDQRYAELAERFGVMVFKGIEADTNLGHLLLFGVTREVMRRFDLSSRMLKSDSLIEVVHGEGGIAIPAHPFRDSGFGPQLDELCARHGAALGVIEALNGQNSPRENEAAMVAMEKLGLVGVGGSDAHFVTPKWFLTCATELDREVGDIEGLCAELRAGRARPFRFEEAPPPANE
jgi:predicted metal-dependent phosphoesterase TrpH